MKRFAIPAATLVLLSAMSLSGARAAPMFSSVDTQVAPSYTQVDCMQRDGDPSGCWRVGSDYGPYSTGYGQDLIHQPVASDARAYFNNNDNSKRHVRRSTSH